MSRPALFLDRDGTIIEDVGDLGDPLKIILIPGAIDAMKSLQSRFVLFIVTNQSAVALGRLTLEQVNEVNHHLLDILSQHSVSIEQVYVCPHLRSQNCACIKPKPHFLFLAQRDYNIDLTRSYSIGDHPHDAAFSPSAGGRGIYVLTGHGHKHLADLPAGNVIINSLADLPQLIDSP